MALNCAATDRMELEERLEATGLNWSNWFRLESSFGLLLVPAETGVFVIAEQLIAPEELSGKNRLLGIIEFRAAADLAAALCRVCSAPGEMRERIVHSQCFARYATAPAAQSSAIAELLGEWLKQQADNAPATESFWVTDRLYARTEAVKTPSSTANQPAVPIGGPPVAAVSDDRQPSGLETSQDGEAPPSEPQVRPQQVVVAA